MDFTVMAGADFVFDMLTTNVGPNTKVGSLATHNVVARSRCSSAFMTVFSSSVGTNSCLRLNNFVFETKVAL